MIQTIPALDKCLLFCLVESAGQIGRFSFSRSADCCIMPVVSLSMSICDFTEIVVRLPGCSIPLCWV